MLNFELLMPNTKYFSSSDFQRKAARSRVDPSILARLGWSHLTMMPNATAKLAWSRVISTVNLTWALSEDLPILTKRPSFPLATATQDQDSQTLTFNSYHLCRALRHALPLKLNCCREKKSSPASPPTSVHVSVYLTMMPKQTAMAAWSSVVSTVNLTWAACCTMLLAPAPTRDTR